jgi:colanic acid biosynthesis glycosyl transferase WcaI
LDIPVKILISASNFTPDLIGAGKFTGEMAEWLAARGHDVRAVVGAPFYPHWKIAPGYSGARYKRERVHGVDVLRCPIYVPSKQTGIRRLLQHATLAATQTPPLLSWALAWKPDLVWTVMPSFAGLPGALLAAKLARAPALLHVQDWEVDAAFELGLFKAPLLKRLLLQLERRLVSAFTAVSIISPRMQELLKTKAARSQSFLFPNWVDTEIIHPLEGPSPLRAEFGIADDAFVALYSGNLGEKQGVDDLIAVARLLTSHPRFVMMIGGDGAGRARLASLAAGYSNVLFVPIQPQDRFNAFLAIADVHLMPQKPMVADLVMPSKLSAMLASGRPVVVGAMEGTQLADEVAGAGIVVPPGDPERMAEAIIALMDSPERSRILGQGAAQRARDHWAKETILEQFESALKLLVKRTA